MENYSKSEILQMVEEEDVEFIRLQFTDMFGVLKNVAIPSSRLIKAMENRCTIDTASLDGFTGGEECDLYLKPDLSTFSILPWRPQQGKVARFLCDVCREDGTEIEDSPRSILKRVVKRAQEKGYTLKVNPECEFFLFHTDDNGQPTNITHEKASYFDVTPLDLGENARRDIVLTLESMGFEIEASHHEVAPAQHEIDFKYDNALITADNIMTFKMVVKTIAKRHGLYATFMPKPITDIDGSGMHINMSLEKDGKNLFFDKKDPLGLSKDCYHFIAGLIKHARGMSCICNPLVNSYKRLVPGYEAPVAICWSSINRSPLIRIPASRGAGTRIEFRSPDPAANPYLVMALCLAAGLDGIENQLEAPEPIGKNMYLLTEEQIADMNIDVLPATLGEACDAFEQDTYIQEVLGEHISKKYLEAKRKEWHEYCRHVSDWETESYLYKY